MGVCSDRLCSFVDLGYSGGLVGDSCFANLLLYKYLGHVGAVVVDCVYRSRDYSEEAVY